MGKKDAKKQPYTLRKLLFDLHLYAGLAIGLLVLVTGLTGSLIVFREEIETGLNPSLMRVQPAGVMLSPSRMIAAAQSAYPNMQIRNLHLPTSPDSAAEVVVKPPQGPNLNVYIDPYSGAALGARQREGTSMKWLVDLHVKLLSGAVGETIVGIGGLLLAMLGLTGLWIWWPRKGQSFRQGFKIKFGANWKRVNYDLHKAGGIFVMILLTITAITGAGMAFNKATQKLIAAVTGTPAKLEPPRLAAPGTGQPLPLDELVSRAEAALPGGQLTRIHLPEKPQDPLRIRKRMPGEWRATGHSQTHLDPFTGAVLRVDDARRFPAGLRIVRALYPLHTGEWGGVSFRVLQLVLGITPGFLFLTGLLMWWNRVMVKKLRPRTQPAKAKEALVPSKTNPDPQFPVSA